MTKEEFQKKIQSVTIPLPGSTPKPIIYKLSVKQKFQGLTIIDFYSQAIPNIPKQEWVQKVNSGNMTINGNSTSTDYIIKTGDKTQHSTPPISEPEINPTLQLIHEDNDILVLNKPAPLPMHPCGRFSKNSLVEILKAAFPDSDFKIVHRIDSNTTGLVVLGKTKGATQFISNQFEQQTIKKSYLTLVEGLVQKDNFTSSQVIGKEKTKSGGRQIDIKGNEAFTEFQVLERRSKTSLLRVTPHSGRTNQIRLHLADIGHPIVGDHGYKNPDYFQTNPLTYPDDCLFLHAWKIAFIHPSNSSEIEFEAPIPEKFITNR